MTRSAPFKCCGTTAANTRVVRTEIQLKGDEKCMGEMLGLLDIGYRGYAGFELCHPLPVVNGKTVGLDFVDLNAQLAAEFMKGIRRDAKKLHANG